MSAELQSRAKAWSDQRNRQRAVQDISMTDYFIQVYANKGHLDLDPEHAEILRLCFRESFAEATTKSGEDAEFARETALILRAIQAELKP